MKEKLQEFIKAVESEEIAAVAICWVAKDGSTGARVLTDEPTNVNYFISFIGLIERMKHDILHFLDSKPDNHVN